MQLQINSRFKIYQVYGAAFVSVDSDCLGTSDVRSVEFTSRTAFVGQLDTLNVGNRTSGQAREGRVDRNFQKVIAVAAVD